MEFTGPTLDAPRNTMALIRLTLEPTLQDTVGVAGVAQVHESHPTARQLLAVPLHLVDETLHIPRVDSREPLVVSSMIRRTLNG
jgi:hypothetical protein